jgi:hypothetical protein
MKKIIAMLILVVSLLVVAIPVMAYQTGYATPTYISASVNVNYWGQPGYWDLTNDTDIPAGATVKSITETYSWQVPATGLQVALLKADGTGWRAYSGTPITGFAGALVKQRWETRCAASVTTWIYNARLFIIWEVPATSSSSAIYGMTEVSTGGASETTILGEENNTSSATSIWSDPNQVID